MIKKNNYNFQELIDCGNGKLFGKGNAKLPLPPMLMFDRITEINDNKGDFNKGFIKAELDIKKNLWFFDCHFKEDPVMPGCLGLDAMWQLIGFFLGWLGEPGKGRALGVNYVKFKGEILRQAKKAVYEINMKKILITRRLLRACEERASKNFDAKLNSNDELYSQTKLIELSKGCDGILTSITDKIDEEIINKLPNTVKIISNFAVGFGNIDLEVAKKKILWLQIHQMF